MKITLTQFRPNTAEAVWTDCFAQAIAELHKADTQDRKSVV